MPRLRKKVDHDFTLINNKMLRDVELGATERGLLITMLSLPDNWNFSIKGLTKILPNGVTQISTALKNLEKLHYLDRKRVYTNGKISDWDYIFSDERMQNPDPENESEDVERVDNVDNSPIHTSVISGNLDLQNLDSENLNQEKQNLENPIAYKINNNQINKNQISNDQESIYQSANQQSNFQQFRMADSNPIDMIDGFETKNQERNATILYVKDQIEYDWYIDFFNEVKDNSFSRGENGGTFASNIGEVDMLLNIIVDVLCSDAEKVRIGKEDFPSSVVKSRFMKIEMKHIEYVLKCLMLNIKNIKNPTAYLRTALYNSTLTCDFAESNQLKNCDPALFIPRTYHDDVIKDRYYEKTAYSDNY